MLYLMTEDRNVYTIGDIYNQNKTDDKMMLSPYPADFWKPYRDNHNYFDRRFKVLYKSFFHYDQEESEGRESVADDFRFDVYAHLMANDKRYSELFRINAIPDNEAYSLTNNVDYTEEYSEESHLDRTFNKGSQTDGGTSFTAYGQQIVDEDKSKTVGQQINDEDISRSYAQHVTTDEHSISAFNESGYSPAEKNQRTDGAHIDTEDNTYTLGSHTDTEDNSVTYGTHRDDSGSNRTEGAREDTTDDDITKEYTMHKFGNMGVQTVDDMLDKHLKVWSMFDFYGFIFGEIARDLLRGC